MKTLKYLDVSVQRNDGSKFNAALKLSEAHFISQLAQENRVLVVRAIEITKEGYNLLFV